MSLNDNLQSSKPNTGAGKYPKKSGVDELKPKAMHSLQNISYDRDTSLNQVLYSPQVAHPKKSSLILSPTY